MTVVTYQIQTTRVQRSNHGFALCECGSPFIIEDHFRKRKPKEVYATVARCSNEKCPMAKTGYIGYDYDDLKVRVNEFRKKQD